MIHRKESPVPATPEGWFISTELALPGHRPILRPGVELTVKLRGRNRRCRFVRAVTTDAGMWLDVFDGRMVRSFSPDLVARVHTTHRMAARL